MFDLSNYSTKSKYNENSTKLSMRKVKDETSGVAIEELDGKSEDKQRKSGYRNVVATIQRI